ncbi:hypothetical protein [Mycobacterium sp. 852002-51961_SCH5331710]|uniref:hypothetical protein n=1 Tax=Mycobacterium sp. 852002-51961_SCH5331710 TaxID=1834105 RepID=UPI000801C605|nr:hypothetical protein [Mycobacterium sp. 852002-51961_SCH5331710]OBB48520.1 hypothetical protein A5752_00025 [Mycobacterium sp. 852002-51961_SCH5331710]
MSPTGLAARLRGVASGLLTATLAAAAHGYGGAELPTGAATVAMAVLAATIGALIAGLSRASEIPVLLGILASGQVVGHILLGVTGHTHAPPSTTMLAAHVLAVGVGAVLIAAGDRLCRAVSRVVRVAVRIVCAPVPPQARCSTHRAEQPLRSALLLAASVSHRGPPVSLAR